MPKVAYRSSAGLIELGMSALVIENDDRIEESQFHSFRKRHLRFRAARGEFHYAPAQQSDEEVLKIGVHNPFPPALDLVPHLAPSGTPIARIFVLFGASIKPGQLQSINRRALT